MYTPEDFAVPNAVEYIEGTPEDKKYYDAEFDRYINSLYVHYPRVRQPVFKDGCYFIPNMVAFKGTMGEKDFHDFYDEQDGKLVLKPKLVQHLKLWGWKVHELNSDNLILAPLDNVDEFCKVETNGNHEDKLILTRQKSFLAWYNQAMRKYNQEKDSEITTMCLTNGKTAIVIKVDDIPDDYLQPNRKLKTEITQYIQAKTNYKVSYRGEDARLAVVLSEGKNTTESTNTKKDKPNSIDELIEQLL